MISGYSQNFYPKKILYQNDTMILISPPQLKEINKKILLKDYYKELYKAKIIYIGEIFTVIEDRDCIIDTQDEQIFALKEKLKTDEDISNRRQEDLKTYYRKKIKNAYLIGGGSGILLIIILKILL